MQIEQCEITETALFLSKEMDRMEPYHLILSFEISFFSKMLPREAWQLVTDKWNGNFRKLRLNRETSNTSEGITFFPKKFHRSKMNHSNSHRNKPVFTCKY